MNTKRNEEDYMCYQCKECIFFKNVNLGMEGTVHLCTVLEPEDSYFKAHVLKWVSALDCETDNELNNFYDRDCSYFVSFVEIVEQLINDIKNNRK